MESQLADGRLAVTILALLAPLLLSAASVAASSPHAQVRESGSPVHSLAITPDPAGGVRATATLVFPAPPEIVQSILTEYRKWPELFDVRMRLAGLEEHPEGVITDLYIEHALMSGARRLLCESHLLPGGGLVTDLKDGDFKRYHRVWKLKAADEGVRTRADFELIVEIDTIVPDWVIAMAMRRELEAHFRIVKERAVQRIKKER